MTLYEPHFPHLVPSEYALYDEPDPEPGPDPFDVPDWDDLPANYSLAGSTPARIRLALALLTVAAGRP